MRGAVFDRLRQIASLQYGERIPDWLYGPNTWGTALSEMSQGALDEITRLEAGYVKIYKLVMTPSHGRHAYTHFQSDFDQIRAICKSMTEVAGGSPTNPA